jgi:putative flavoprotein involved in K+ transport
VKTTTGEFERIQTVIVGAGQAGLSIGYHLSKRGLPFVILDGNDRIGDSWRQRWDSLRLFTPARWDGLDGMPFPAPPDTFPTKDDMANYLEAYARRFELPVRTGVRVTRVSKCRYGYLVAAGGRQIEAEHVVVAMASYQQPKIPVFASQLSPNIVQLHSREYRGPRQLQDGDVLIVGAGNSGAEIAMDLKHTHRVWMSGRATGQVPFRVDSLAGRKLLLPFTFRVLFHRILTLDTPLGRKARPSVISQGTPLIRTKEKNLAAAGVQRVPRVSGIERGLPRLADGRVLDVANVIWCTGFDPGFSWIDLPIFDADGEPRHERGVVPGESGLYFVGLHFLYAMSSTMIHGVGRDAEYLAEVIQKRIPSSVVTPLLRQTA